MRAFLFALLLTVPVLAQEASPVVPTPPVLDALDRQAITAATEALALADTGCKSTKEAEHYQTALKLANSLIEARYQGYRYDWTKKALVVKDTKK